MATRKCGGWHFQERKLTSLECDLSLKCDTKLVVNFIP
jgi:hypothetical protein